MPVRSILLPLAATFLLAGATTARAQDTERLMRDLSRCDGTFFKSVADARDALSRAAPLQARPGAAAFAVPERRHPVESRVLFKQPLQALGLQVVGYFDEIVDLPQGMSSYSWGFLVAASVEATAAQLKPLVWEAGRLRPVGPVFVRSEVWTHAAAARGWAAVATEADLPKPGTVERVLLIEPYDGETSFIRVGCSLQGNVTAPMLRELRPDLLP